MSSIGSKVTVKLTEFIEAIERKTKMRKAPNGSRSTGLREGAFIPAVGGFRVEMPGGHHFVWALEGQLSEEITFEPSNLVGVFEPPPMKWSAPMIRKAEDHRWRLRDPSPKRLS